MGAPRPGKGALDDIGHLLLEEEVEAGLLLGREADQAT